MIENDWNACICTSFTFYLYIVKLHFCVEYIILINIKEIPVRLVSVQSVPNNDDGGDDDGGDDDDSGAGGDDRMAMWLL